MQSLRRLEPENPVTEILRRRRTWSEELCNLCTRPQQPQYKQMHDTLVIHGLIQKQIGRQTD